MLKIYKKIKVLKEFFLGRKGSFAITDEKVIDSFISDPENTFLVSFPRTGSHWLRMLMELYFERPSLVRVFYYPEQKEYLTLHTHDLDLRVERRKVIYLYRDPVDTIYSQLYYHGSEIDDQQQIRYWADLYGRHLNKWLYLERFTHKKTVVRYEKLKTDLIREFKKICGHFGVPLDVSKLLKVSSIVTKEHVKGKTFHDSRVINRDEKYEERRHLFRNIYGDLVWEVLLNGREHLKEYF